MLLIDFICWKLIDAYRLIKKRLKKEPIKINMYGIYGFFGLPGKGKTMALSWQLNAYRKKYGKKILIMTNYNYKDQDIAFTTWRQLLQTYDKPVVVAWDEVQNEFTSRDFKSFPIELLTILTQNRKGNGIQVLYTAQRWERVDKIFRELTHYAVQCSTFWGRLTTIRYYHWEDYVQMQATTNVERKDKIWPMETKHFIQTDDLRESYDSYKMLETAKKKEYAERPQNVLQM